MGEAGKNRYNGLSFDTSVGDLDLHVMKCTLDITDNSTIAKRNGRPSGKLRGDVEASGKITIDRDGLKAITAAAKEAGSFQQLPSFDINTYAKMADDDELKIEAFECYIKIEALLNIDKSSTDETTFELPFDVGGEDFVHIDGVPYLETLD